MAGGANEVSFSVRKLYQVWAVLVTFSPVLSGYTWSSTAKTLLDHNLALSPEFDDFTIREVEAIEGQTLLLPCTVRFLGDKVVSWIRSRDLHILTSGRFTFSSDNRFESVPSPAGDFWGLRIRGVLLSDTGQYECQVNTDPKMSLAFNLTVSSMRKFHKPTSKFLGEAQIKGPSEVYVRDGSQVTFTCEISPLSVASPQSGRHGVFMTTKPKVLWLHDDKELLFQAHSQFSTKSFWNKNKLTSVLKIDKVNWKNSGLYTCLQMSIKPNSVRLYVIEKEHSEAMQRDFPLLSSSAQSFFHNIYYYNFLLSSLIVYNK